jgi:hypothetical protein
MNPTRISIKYGVITAAVLIGYFLLVKLIGLHENIWLRLLNGVIMALGVYAAIRLRKLIEGSSFEYFNGFRTGVVTGFIATFIFIGFMAVYMYHLDTEFAISILDRWLTDYKQGPGILLFVLTIEGLASAVILTLAFMQKFKPSWNTTKKVV